MLLSESVEISVLSNNKKYLESSGYKIEGDTVIINISDLGKYSRQLVSVKCDICGDIKETQYNLYLKNISNAGIYVCTKKECINEKKKITNLKKFGKEWASQNDNIKDKVKKTNLEKYGVDNILMSESVIEKRKKSFIDNKESINDKRIKTNIYRYGSECPLSNDLIKEKIKKTNLERYGVENPMSLNENVNKSKKTKLEKHGDENFNNRGKSILTNNILYGVNYYTQSNEYKEKVKETNLKKYGVEYYTKTDEFKEKVKETNLKKYGVEYYTKTDEFKEKVKETNLEKYGVDWYLQSKDCKEKTFITNLEKYGVKNIIELEYVREKAKISNFNNTKNYIIDKYSKLLNKDYKILDYSYDGLSIKHLDHEFYISIQLLYDRLNYSSNYEICTKCNPINSNSSHNEDEIYKWILSIFDDINKPIINRRDRVILGNGQEIDIYLPEYNLAIEYNGLYWHSELFKNKYYHINKTKICKEKGIRLIHIFEDDWLCKKEIVKSIILNHLKITNDKIYSRKCKVKNISSKKCRDFLDNNHIQGYSRCKYKIGLFHNNELVSVMTFGNRKINNIEQFELIRFCNKINTSVVGSASKLFKHFIFNNNIEHIVSYADISIFTGDIYTKLGFTFKHLSSPNYFWFIDNKRFHRFKFNKKKLIKEGFDSNKTGNEIMNNRGYYKIWSCGQYRFDWYR